MESLNLNNLHDFNFQYGKPTLWVYGGHPLVPSSRIVFDEIQAIMAFSVAVWQKKNLLDIPLDDKKQLTDAMLSANQDLRRLAMEGLSMAIVATKTDEDVSTIVDRLDDVHQRLRGKVDFERSKLLSQTSVPEVKSCCSVSSDILCNINGFSGWLASLPLLNLKSINLDGLLLERILKYAQKDPSEARKIIMNSEYLLNYAKDYSLQSSSRSPLEYVQHQIISWINDAWATVDNVHVEVANSILQMWYNYHSSLWTYCSGSPKSLSVAHDEICDLAHLTKMDAINTIMQRDLRVVDYQKNCFMLRISSGNLWEGVSCGGNFVASLHSVADSLFKQIIFAHKEHFEEEDFNKLEAVLLQQPKRYIEKEGLGTICALLSSSSHAILASLAGSDELIESLLMDLYPSYSRDSLFHTGAAWMHIGMLRFRLLLSSYSPDPAFESAYIHSNIIEKISLVKLEGKVRHDCEELAGSSSPEDNHDKLLQDLETEEKGIRAKVVFRPQQSKHKSFIAACFEFENRLSDCKDLLANLNCEGAGQLEVDRVCNWQITSMNFIKRLTEEYGEYTDLVQPIQVAVYEMKLGLAIALSGYLQKGYLKKIKEDGIEKVLGTIVAVMEFPSGSITERFVTDMTDVTEYAVDDKLKTQNSGSRDVDVLKKLAIVSSQLNVGKVGDKVKSHSEMLVSIHHMVLVRTAYHVSCSLIMDSSSYLSLKETFDHFTSMWIDMKSHLKAKENDDSHYYKFKSRTIDIEEIFKDVPLLLDMDIEGNIVPDNEEKLEQEFSKITERINEDNGVIEHSWDAIPESVLKCIVIIHNQLFGSPDLFEKPSKCPISDAQKIQSFIDSYDLGTRILKDLPELTCSMFDEKLMPEHLFRVCLEYRQTSAASFNCRGYNAYKDPNPSVIFKMVEPLSTLQKKVREYLEEWPDHPGLLKILDTTASMLAMPLSTPISKALLGLQLLASKAQTLQENDSKFFLKDHLPPIFLLVYSWQKLELDCWPLLVEEVQEKYDMDAIKLWFPLRALLTQTSGISTDEDLSITRSIEEFVQTSNLGEFKRRLHLLLAFHGEISDGASVGAYSSARVKKIQNILYNVFGYYMQFLSLVHKEIEAGKQPIEQQLKDRVNLYSWEQAPYSTTSIENFKRARQKIFKLLQKFNEVLRKPVIVLLSEEATARKVPCWLDPRWPESQFPLDTEKFNKRYVWYKKWASDTSLSLQGLLHANVVGVPTVKEYTDIVQNVNHRQDEIEHNDRLKCFWAALERICGAANFAHTLKHGKKNQKKAALSNLFKTLEECGLTKHRPMGHEWRDELSAPNSLFLEQSYDAAHLLQQVSSQKKLEDVSIVHCTLLTTDNWKHANCQYFKCLAMMQQLRQVSLKFNKDLGLEEVNRATSFMNHLLTILSEQRHFAYNLLDQLNQFQHAIFLLGSGGGRSLSSCQNVLLSSMWQQKKLFDNVLTLTTDTNLLLKSFKDCHDTSCSNFEEVAAMSTLLEKFVSRFSESKVVRQEEASMRSIKEVLISRLEDLLDKKRLVDCKPETLSSIEVHLNHLHTWLGVILSSVEGILSELLEAHRTTADITHALGDIFIYLFGEGFGSTEDTSEDAEDEQQQDAVETGTGMGDGDGGNNVSTEIEDESQIEDLAKDVPHKPDQAPKNDDEAVEMKEDFDAPLSDVSEDPEGKDSGNEDEDMNLDSQMGDTGDSSEVVGKKSWDKDEDDDPKTSTEKYDSASSVKGTEKNDRELRAKDDGSVEEEDQMEMDNDEQGKNNDLEEEPVTCEETDPNTEEVMDKTDAYDDRTGPELPEPDNDSEDIDMERQESDEEDAGNEDIDSEEVEHADQRSDASDDMELGDIAQHGDSAVDNEGDHIEDANTEPGDIDKLQLDEVDSLKHPSEGQPDNMQVDNNREPEANLANSSDMNGAVAPSVNFSGNEVPNMEISVPNSGNDSRLSNAKSEMQNDVPQSNIKQANPFRSIGDAMEDWKERARVSADTQDHPPETGHQSDDEDATQFRYVPEGEQSTSQALGAATADQISDDTQIKQSFMEDESRAKKLEQSEERSPDNTEVPHIQASQALTSKSENVNELEGPEIQTNTSIQDLVEVREDSSFQNLVSFKRPLADDKIDLDGLTVGTELSTQMDLDIPDAETERAIVDWKNIELATMKLSQELAEQLRLVMEPTLASRLQGDYRTGKRINMKKVVPYIASHFRRDKIWLRRTKPNKRNYQVVIAVDDSRSMSEGKCGKVAIEALVTVCRAMSQLEVGQFSVASFGKKGNVRVLHDFDHIFNSEAGVKMISSLSFEQDNKIEDQPVSDLLTHLNTMLDTAVARARTPSGQNPLQQLILIISDGKFHEKDLRRHVRDVLNRKRMVAYVLLDSPEDSIMNLREACFKAGEDLKLEKYMDSFPFPYYVMLQNIEALPRTLADLLRQWFEIMQSANE
nr:unnamed protein product [Digitaria exilis]